ncbi:GNAT family N-acetyltransferase [Microbulbifer sp. SAOS-129_SWC]|uniref:GNAT family N-acetyltransferase n=1 Tax=Microbulbifer sp. SAOS-129_SWC TaxID=3145235 RepID=UPI0032169BC1
METLTFRPCEPRDVDAAVPLIYSSGPAAFDYAFCDSAAGQAREFLHSAFVRNSSEFSYQQHTAAIADGRLVGIGAVRNATQNLRFTGAALGRILAFYSPLAALRTVTRGLRTEQVIKPPASGVGILYHLGVAPEYRGRGIGRQLVDQLLQRIHTQQLPVAALDVAESNPRARALYEQLGFSARTLRRGTLTSAFGRVADHTYMELPLHRALRALP